MPMLLLLGCEDQFQPVEDVIVDQFLPQMLGCEFYPKEGVLFALQVKYAGLGITNPNATLISALETSQKATSHLGSTI